MAVVKNPLLSIDAHGALGSALIYQPWKKIETVRAYFQPGQPRSPLQVTQRDAVTAATFAWRNYFAPSSARSAWARAASVMRLRLAGYHLAMRSLIPEIRDLPGPEFVWQVQSFLGTKLNICFLDATDGMPNNELGDFHVYAGPTPTSMVLVTVAPMDFGCIITPPVGVVGDIIYSQVFKNGVARSGIHRTEIVSSLWEWTLLSASPSKQWTNITMSDNGQYVYAFANAQGAWRSDDSGQTWAQIVALPALTYADAKSSSTGQYVTYAPITARPKQSSDFGITWSDITAMPSTAWASCALSPDGSFALFGRNNFRSYEVTPLSGSGSLTSLTANEFWRGQSISSDNLVQIMCTDPGRWYYTLDGGAVWNLAAGNTGANTGSTGLNSTGTQFYAYSAGNNYQISNDNGATWAPRADPGSGFSDSAAYATIAPVALIAHVFTADYSTNDLGLAWLVQDPWAPADNRAFAVSHSGAIAYASVFNGQIWRGVQT